MARALMDEEVDEEVNANLSVCCVDCLFLSLKDIKSDKAFGSVRDAPLPIFIPKDANFSCELGTQLKSKFVLSYQLKKSELDWPTLF